MDSPDQTLLRLGGVVTTWAALGPAARSNWVGVPVEGHGFATRYAEDLVLLGELGVTDVRLGFDWARLQPEPTAWDDDWREWYESVLLAARRAQVRIWAVLHENTVPRWFDDEGSFGDARSAGRWWPRFVERCAETFGDDVAGWVPLRDPISVAGRWSGDARRHEAALVNVAVAWRDAWRVLRGGPPVASALAVHMTRPADQTIPAIEAARRENHLRWQLWLRAWRDGLLRLPGGAERTVADLAGSLDVLGIATTLDLPEGKVGDDALRAWGERLGTVCRRAAEEGPDRPVHLELAVAWPQADERRLLVERATAAVADARADGVPIEALFVEPAIAGSTMTDSTKDSTTPVTTAMTGRGGTYAAFVTRDRDGAPDLATWQRLTR